jgi:hypothetical protein
MRNDVVVRVAGLLIALTYAGFIAWLYAAQPRNLAEITGGVSSTLGVYRVDEAALAEGRRFFTQDKFVEARDAFARADPATRDARTQFYVAYSFYREGWHRTYHDDVLYRQGLEAIARALALAPGGALHVDDPEIAMHEAIEVKTELEAGLVRTAADFNPLRLLEPRK